MCTDVHCVSEYVSTVLHPAQHIIRQFGDKSFQAITCAAKLKRNKRKYTNKQKEIRKTTKQTN